MTDFKISIYKPHARMVHGMEVKVAMSEGHGFDVIPVARWVELLQQKTFSGAVYWICKPLETPDSAEPYLVPQARLFASMSEFENLTVSKLT